ncbi:hypothetical protein SLS63_006501 [Diaporthe eres]|uniref:Aminoglycoside phosphotransferase domain-containing protein n=1 Tax=Diaporthe eres TaxID=83184 RepID=A0ABR1P7S7_DIAER
MSHPPLPLPQVPGPKLGPFTPDAHAEIKFIEALGSSDDLDSEVWKVEIDGTVYALKMNVLARELAQPLSSSQAYEDYYDPFNCECRAYGRLAQENRLDLAVPAHGYLLLTPQQEREVTPMVTGGLEYEPDDEEPLGTLNGEKTWGRWEEHRGQPIRAIVKELVEDDDFEEAFKTGRISASTMWRDLEDLHALGILVQDIHIGNYIGCRLDWWMETLVVDELDIPESLQGCDAGENDRGTDPRGYNWLRWEEDGEAAAAYVDLDLFTRESE